jgi:hypothetical protein
MLEVRQSVGGTGGATRAKAPDRRHGWRPAACEKSGNPKKRFMAIREELWFGMSRSRKQSFERFFDTMESCPWWVSLFLGGAVGGVWWATLVSLPEPATRAIREVWWLVPAVFGGLAVGSWMASKLGGRPLSAIRGLKDLRRMPGREFTKLTAAYFREAGFTVTEAEGEARGGGGEMLLLGNNERVFVTCTKCRREKIDLERVREFLGVAVAEDVDRAIFVTTSRFTPEAMEFGLRQPLLDLIPGEQFARMVAQLRQRDAVPMATADDTGAAPGGNAAGAPPRCPRCDNAMHARTTHPGRPVWACSRFPDCDGTKNVF